MKRGSVIGPALLILIGGMLLAHNVKPDLPVLEMAARHWPWLLVGWGAVRVMELLYLRAQSMPLPRAGISGGEWFLAILICLAGATLTVASRYSDRWPQARILMRGVEVLGDNYDFALEAEKPAGKTSRIVVENLRGSTLVVGSDGDQIKVKGRSTVRALRKADADKVAQECPLEITGEGEMLVVKTNQDRVKGPERVHADIEVIVPRGVSVLGRTRTADIDVSNVAGSVEVRGERSGVRLKDIGGDVSVEVRYADILRGINLKGKVDFKGRGQDIELENVGEGITIDGSYSGELNLRSVGGPIQYTSSRTDLRVEKLPGQMRMVLSELRATNVTGPFRLKTRTRDVRLEDFRGPIEISLNRGDITLLPSTPLAPVEVRTGSGDIELAVPGSAKFGLEAHTENGEVFNDFGPPLEAGKEGQGGRVSAPSGQQPLLRLNTSRGRIQIRKGDLPAAAKPTAANLKLEQH